MFLSRNLDQNMLKNAYFGGKAVKFAAALGVPPPNPFLPQPTALLLLSTIRTLSSPFLVLNAF